MRQKQGKGMSILLMLPILCLQLFLVTCGVSHAFLCAPHMEDNA